MISIIVPAHNEENVIARCLTPLLPGARDNELEIIVVCNGCTDATAQIVAEFKEHVTLIETPIPSKANALNLGDEVASGFPRFYLDADIVMSLESVRKVAEVLRSGKFLAAAPQMKVNYSHSSWLVKAYYDVWQQLPYVKEGMIGTGVYALSEEGRKRFVQFPDIIADDRFVRALFAEQERAAVERYFSLVTAPSGLTDLIKIKTRSRAGGYEFEKKFDYLVDNEKKEYATAFFKVVIELTNIPKLPVYLFVNIISRIKVKKMKKNRPRYWSRDDSSRNLN
jgi:glycosyltransferase involved in cell wall biosynthesis